MERQAHAHHGSQEKDGYANKEGDEEPPFENLRVRRMALPFMSRMPALWITGAVGFAVCMFLVALAACPRLAVLITVTSMIILHVMLPFISVIYPG